jgi:hypothetical protein
MLHDAWHGAREDFLVMTTKKRGGLTEGEPFVFEIDCIVGCGRVAMGDFAFGTFAK